MGYATVKAGILAACMFGAQGLAFAENPLFMPKADTGPPLISANESEGLKKEAEALKRKAELLKSAAGKKYAAAGELRKKAGGFRSESSRKGEMLRSKAEQSADVSSFIGSMFGILSSMGGMGGAQFSPNSAVLSSLTSTMLQDSQSSAAKGVSEAHGKSGKLSMEAEKKAGPMEMKADELEGEGNKLMEAQNRLMAIANAKLLLVAADELLRKVDGDRRRIEWIKDSTREFAASMPGR
jgi:hypothetical protein